MIGTMSRDSAATDERRVAGGGEGLKGVLYVCMSLLTASAAVDFGGLPHSMYSALKGSIYVALAVISLSHHPGLAKWLQSQRRVLRYVTLASAFLCLVAATAWPLFLSVEETPLLFANKSAWNSRLTTSERRAH